MIRDGMLPLPPPPLLTLPDSVAAPAFSIDDLRPVRPGTWPFDARAVAVFDLASRNG